MNRLHDHAQQQLPSESTTWRDILATAAAVRGEIPGLESEEHSWRPRFWTTGGLRRLIVNAANTVLILVVTLGLVLNSSVADALPVAADGGADSTLFTLTNQDRASNGVPSLRYNGTLAGIAEATQYHICGMTVAGRSADMIQRGYFSHYIPPCGQLVFVIMQEAGVRYQSAGENIGWVSNETSSISAATYINGQFMNSTDHRTNILSRNFTDIGIGSSTSGGAAWSGGGSAQTNAWMFSEEFAQLGSPAPAQPAPHAAAPAPRNSQAPAPPQVPPATAQGPAAAPTPLPTAFPEPSANPFSAGVLATGDATPPLIWQQGGLLSDSVESVLETYLIG